jgi:hypothetical protein
MSVSGVFAAGSRDLVGWRAWVRRWAGAVHAAGLLVLGTLMLTTEGPSAPVGNSPPVLAAAAWCSLAAVVVFWLVQGVTLAAWWRCSRAVRKAAGGRVRARWALRVFVALLLATVWTAEVGYFVQAVVCVRTDGWFEPVSGLAVALVAAAMLTGLAALAGVVTLLAVAVVRAVLRSRAVF